MNCDPTSVMSSSGAVKRHECRYHSSEAAIAITSGTTRRTVKVSMINIMYFSPTSEGERPIVSLEILSIGFRVDRTNRDARMILCLVFIFWLVGQLCSNCLTSCRKVWGHSVPLVSSGACCVISAIVRFTPSVHGGMYRNVGLRFVVPHFVVALEYEDVIKYDWLWSNYQPAEHIGGYVCLSPTATLSWNHGCSGKVGCGGPLVS